MCDSIRVRHRYLGQFLKKILTSFIILFSGKTEKSSTDYISARSEINELKSMLAFKESKIKDLSEKNEESRNFYEAEGQHWKR